MNKKHLRDSRPEIKKIIALLWWVEVAPDRFYIEVFGGQRIYFDLSATHIDYIGKIMVEQAYRVWETDWEFKIKEQIKEIL